MRRVSRAIRLLSEIRGENLFDTLLIWGRVGWHYVLGGLSHIFLPQGIKLKADKRRWKWFARYALRKFVFYREVGIWIDLFHILHYNGVGDFPKEWIFFDSGEVGFQVGANRGEYTFWAASRVGSSGLCVALEPNPEAYVDLVRLAALNKFPQVICLPFACGSSFYQAEFHADIDALSVYGDGIFTMRDLVGAEGRFITFQARVVPLDAVVEGLGITRLDFLIIDVEGAELEVLKGAQRSLTSYKPRLYIELHGTADEVETYLRSEGYRFIETVGDREGRAHLRALPE